MKTKKSNKLSGAVNLDTFASYQNALDFYSRRVVDAVVKKHKSKPTLKTYCAIMFKRSTRSFACEILQYTEQSAKRFKKQYGDEVLLLEIDRENFQKPKVIS